MNKIALIILVLAVIGAGAYFLSNTDKFRTGPLILGPHENLTLRLGQSRSFALDVHAITVTYLSDSPTHKLDITVDNKTQAIEIESAEKACPDKTETILDPVTGEKIGVEKTEVPPCDYYWTIPTNDGGLIAFFSAQLPNETGKDFLELSVALGPSKLITGILPQ